MMPDPNEEIKTWVEDVSELTAEDIIIILSTEKAKKFFHGVWIKEKDDA